MQQRREPADRHFFAQDARDIGVGFARMDDQRQLKLARQSDLGAKHPFGHVLRRIIIVMVQPRLAEADAFGMGGEAAQRRPRRSQPPRPPDAGCVPMVK